MVDGAIARVAIRPSDRRENKTATRPRRHHGRRRWSPLARPSCSSFVVQSRRRYTDRSPLRPREDDDVDDDDALAAGADEQASSRSESELMDEVAPDSAAVREVPGGPQSHKPPHEREWTMPRTGMSLPSLPEPGDISSYLLGRVLTADDIKPAAKLLNTLQGAGQAAEVLYILAPLVYAVALARSRNKKSWTPWLVGLAVEYAARQLRDRSLRTTTLERDEWNKRGWAMGWWTMRGAFYDNVTKSVVGGVTRRMPGFIAGILEDYEYLWENYYFSTSA